MTAAALAGLVLILLAVHVVTRDGPGPGVFSSTAIWADLPLLLGSALPVALALAGLRFLLTRRILRSRVQFELLPADTFDPSLDAVRRFAVQLARTRRGFLVGWLERPGSAVRVLIAPDEQGVLRYRLEAPARARTALAAALTAYSQLEVRECDPLPFPDQGCTVRVELRLAHEPGRPLGDPGLDPDPLHTKKKEKVGNFANGRAEWEPEGRPVQVNDHDFPDEELGKAVPYGIYDVAASLAG